VLGDIEPNIAERVVVMVSELATNSVRHAHSSFAVTVERTPRDSRSSVFDVGLERPAMRSPRPGEPTGRGLRIVEALADNWGVTTHAGAGKTVWFSLPSIA
jgi:anti-sigma regulatory factor (Ser/Thr protein kinase)